MGFGFKQFLQGLRLVPVSSTSVSQKGDLEVLDSSGKLNYFNGTSASSVVTEAHTQTLTNKTIDGNNNTVLNISTTVANNSVTEAKLTTSVAGNGLSGGNGTALAVNVDSSTIEINSDTLRVKASGITANELSSDSVTTVKILNANVTEAKLSASVAGNGLSGGAGTALSVNVDNTTTEITADTVKVKAQTSQVIGNTPNGHGSTNTAIRRWTNATSTGSAITYADSATNGMTLTINEDGMYQASYSDLRSGGIVAVGFSINSAQLSTDINAINVVNRIMMIEGTTNTLATTSCVFRAVATDVVRTHDGQASDLATAKGQFRILKIGP